MEKSQRTGLIIMIVAVFQLILFLRAMTQRSYMAVALPVMSALTAVSALAFWIGWSMFTAASEEMEEEGEELPLEPPAD